MSQPYSHRRKQRAAHIFSVVGENIRTARVGEEVTQAQAAKLLGEDGTHESYFRGVENGHKQISLVRLVEIADALGVAPESLLRGV
ncbi:MAG: helix-turn-helix domain-containing protein [Mycobacterium sp.]